MRYRQWQIEVCRILPALWHYRLTSPYGVLTDFGVRVLRRRCVRAAQAHVDRIIRTHYPQEAYPPPTRPLKPGQPPLPFLVRGFRLPASPHAAETPPPHGPSPARRARGG